MTERRARRCSCSRPKRGKIRGWNPGVTPPAPSTRSFVVANRSYRDANYKGLAISSSPQGNLLYATDFHNGRVDVFDAQLHVVLKGSFVDPHLPAGYGPFGIQALGGYIFVTYAKQDADAGDEVAGPGLGFGARRRALAHLHLPVVHGSHVPPGRAELRGLLGDPGLPAEGLLLELREGGDLRLLPRVLRTELGDGVGLTVGTVLQVRPHAGTTWLHREGFRPPRPWPPRRYRGSRSRRAARRSCASGTLLHIRRLPGRLGVRRPTWVASSVDRSFAAPRDILGVSTPAIRVTCSTDSKDRRSTTEGDA